MLYEITFNKKKNQLFDFKFLLIDLFKIFLITYTVTIIFWPEMHDNFFMPQEIIIEYFKQLKDGNYGLYWGLLNGQIINLSNTPYNYLLINFLYKMPEFFVVSIPLLFLILLFDYNFFLKNIVNFKKNFLYLLLFIILPIILFILLSIKVTVGLKFFLFLVPFLSILPAIVFYYLFKKKGLISKILLTSLSFLFLFYLLIFFKITPYQYTYINSLNGKFSNNIDKFENDYWGLSLKQLINDFKDEYPIKKGKKYKIAFCGVGLDIAEHYLNKIEELKYMKVPNNEVYDFIIMTNLLNGDKYDTEKKVKSCFNEFKGKNLIEIKRMNLKLSVLRSGKS